MDLRIHYKPQANQRRRFQPERKEYPLQGQGMERNAVSRLLRNEKYTRIERYKEYVFDNIVPAIITDEVFKEAQKEFDMHKRKNKVKLVDYKFLLNEKLYCGNVTP